MDLSLLRDSLPGNNTALTDRELLDSFKAAALSVTTLYKASLKTSKRAYNEGYAACLRDVLNFVQAGVSAEGRMAELGGNDGSGALGLALNFDVDGQGMTIGRVMDWVESRLETLTGDDDDNEAGGSGREEDYSRTRPQVQPSVSVLPEVPPIRQATPPIPIPTSQPAHVQSTLEFPSASSSSSTPTPVTVAPNQSPLRTRSKLGRYTSRQPTATHPPSPVASLPASTTSSAESNNENQPSSTIFSPLEWPLPGGPVVGSKRRHAAMVSEIGGNSDTAVLSRTGPPSASRRPIRRSLIGLRGNPAPDTSDSMDSMDLEDLEPARKRVARR